MTKLEFAELISGLENEPFRIRSGNEYSPELRFVKLLSDSVMTELNGKPVVYKLSMIDIICFETSCQPLTEYEKPQTETNASADEPAVIVGTLTSYNKQSQSGIIEHYVIDIGFTLKQIKDTALRNLMFNKSPGKIKVKFIVGKDSKGQLHADSIEPVVPITYDPIQDKLTRSCIGSFDFSNKDNMAFKKNNNSPKRGLYQIKTDDLIDPILIELANCCPDTPVEIPVCYYAVGTLRKDPKLICIDPINGAEFKNKYSYLLSHEELEKYDETMRRRIGAFFKDKDNQYIPLEDHEFVTEKMYNSGALNIQNVIKTYTFDQIIDKINKYRHDRDIILKYFEELTKRSKSNYQDVLRTAKLAVREQIILNRFTVASDVVDVLENYLTHKDLLELKISIERNNDINSFISLLEEYMRNYGIYKIYFNTLINSYIKCEKYEQALELINKYRGETFCIPNNQQTCTMYVFCLNITGKRKEAAEFLESLVDDSKSNETKMAHLIELAEQYTTMQCYPNAVAAYEKWLKLYEWDLPNIPINQRQVFINRRSRVMRDLMEAYRLMGEIGKANELAMELRNIGEDAAILTAESIEPPQPEQNDPDDEIYEDDNIFFEEHPKFIKDKLVEYENVVMSRLFESTVKKNGRSIGTIDKFEKRVLTLVKGITENDNEAVEKIKKTIGTFLKDNGRKNLSELYDSYMKAAYLISIFLANGLELPPNEKRNFNIYIGNAFFYKAIETMQNGYKRNTARYYLLLALQYLKIAPFDKMFIKTFNMVFLSHFLSDRELLEVYDSEKYGEQRYDSKVILNIPDSCLSSYITELLLFTFNYFERCRGKKKNNFTTPILDGIYGKEVLRDGFCEKFSVIRDDETCFSEAQRDSEGFKSIWEKAKDSYSSQFNKLKEYIGRAVTEPYDDLRVIKEIDNFLDMKLLCSDDRTVLEKIRDVLIMITELEKITRVSEREENLILILESIRLISRYISTSPTDLTYEHLMSCAEGLETRIVKMLNDLYISAEPSLTCSACDVAYYNDGEFTTKVTFSIRSKTNTLNAKISNIRIEGVECAAVPFGEPDHPLTSVRGGEKEEYSIAVRFTEKEIERRSIDLRFSFDYSFSAPGSGIKTNSFADIFQINLSSDKEFPMIENSFMPYCDSAAVDSDKMFYGREREINDIVEMLDMKNGKVLSHRGIYLYGQKRAGKSSLMSRIKKRIAETYPDEYIIIDIGSIGGAEESNSYETVIKTAMLRKLRSELKDKHPDIFSEIRDTVDFRRVRLNIEADPNTSEFDDALDEIEAAAKGKVIMLFVDEFTYVYERICKYKKDISFPHFWKTLLQNHNICAIVAGQDNMTDFTKDHNYVNDLACMTGYHVSYLAEEDARRLIYEPILDNGESRFEQEAVDLIYELTAGSAYLIMIFCTKLVEYMNNTSTSRVTKTTVRTFLNKYLFSPASMSPMNESHFDPQINDPCFYDEDGRIIRDNTAILKYIAMHCGIDNRIKIKDIKCSSQLSDTSEEYLDKLIKQLIARKVLLPDGEYCRIWVDLLRHFLRLDERTDNNTNKSKIIRVAF